jgi:hypothetical protein
VLFYHPVLFWNGNHGVTQSLEEQQALIESEAAAGQGEGGEAAAPMKGTLDNAEVPADRRLLGEPLDEERPPSAMPTVPPPTAAPTVDFYGFNVDAPWTLVLEEVTAGQEGKGFDASIRCCVPFR